MIVTKYFNAEKDWENYRSGSFKLGTLLEYRSCEPMLARMSDKEEGVSVRGYGQGSGYIKRLKLPGGGVIENCSFEGVGSAVAYAESFNEHVWCATSGKYDAEHHGHMMRGTSSSIGGEYLGNPDLDAYVEIDFRLFMKGVREWALSNVELSYSELLNGALIWRKVSYGERMSQFELEDDMVIPSGISEEQYMRTLFTKPIEYGVEKEIRLVLRSRYPYFASNQATAIFPKSKLLRRSVISMGELAS